MAATIEVKFFNSFLLKKTIKSNIPIWNGSTGVPEGVTGSNPVANGGAQDNSYYVEEARIRGGYNKTATSYGVRAYLKEDKDDQSLLDNQIIY